MVSHKVGSLSPTLSREFGNESICNKSIRGDRALDVLYCLRAINSQHDQHLLMLDKWSCSKEIIGQANTPCRALLITSLVLQRRCFI